MKRSEERATFAVRPWFIHTKLLVCQVHPAPRFTGPESRRSLVPSRSMARTTAGFCLSIILSSLYDDLTQFGRRVGDNAFSATNIFACLGAGLRRFARLRDVAAGAGSNSGG